MTNKNLQAFAVMDYMKVVNRFQDNYVKAEKAWKPVHQARIDQNIITGWYLYKVHFAYDDNPYNFATINTYDDFVKLEDPYPRQIIENVHPDLGYDCFEDETEASRTKMRSEMSVLASSAIGTARMDKPSKYLKVAFIQVDEKDKDAYIKMESEVWKDAHQNLNDAGVQDWWALYQLEFPHGSSVNYQFITISAVSEYKNLEDLDYLGAYKKAHPNRDFDSDMEKTLQLRSAYRAELWELVDHLEK
ncbi:hypothetical protein [Flagellimonas sp. CMM7]|uniref:hypothetical protein n=1 Tax=Flagellimonas sp. CMM7 TaxID=2654676 RepID=UPI0013D0DF07|nr:hypothetical protein [Flagellimonas sp. CMM7]UII80334.1 hypothetical protein LV704_02195 [Flagellimonas sp. CMM7]